MLTVTRRTLITVIIVLIFITMAAFVWFFVARMAESGHNSTEKTVHSSAEKLIPGSATYGKVATKEKGCERPIAQALIHEDNLLPTANCMVDDYVTDTGEKITMATIKYGDEQNRAIKTYFVDIHDKVLASYARNFEAVDLSLGSPDARCKVYWTNNIRAMAIEMPHEIKRILIKKDGVLEWRIQLTNFSGRLHGADLSHDSCLRTGTITTGLNGEDAKIIGTPTIVLN